MTALDALAKISVIVPTAPRPVKRPSLVKRLLFTFLAAIVYIILSSTPLYGVQTAGRIHGPPILSIILAMNWGTLAQLGIGPIVTASLILQILAGAKIVSVDLSNSEDREKFTLASKGLAVLLAAVEAAAFVIGGVYWYIPQAVPWWVKVAVFAQLFWGGVVIMMMDEVVQKGWGMGSGVSLFILVGVAQRFFTELLGPATVEAGGEIYGLIPYIINAARLGNLDVHYILVGRMLHNYPALVGLITSVALVAVLAYLNVARINVPIVLGRYGGLRSKVPLQLLYVTNIPVLLTSILISNVILMLNLLREYLGVEAVTAAITYLSPPNIFTFQYYPLQAVIYIVLFFCLCIAFGLLWVELAGLSPEAQAENLVKAGLEVPGMRRSTKVLASYLSKYVYSLTIFSSIVVALVSLVGDIFGCYGTGVGLLLATGIVYNYYQMLIYERSLEMYPLLRRFVEGA